MISPKDRQHLATALRISRIVWYALAGSVVIYVALAQVIKGNIQGIEGLGDSLPTLRTLLMVVGVVTLFVTPFVRKLIMKTARDTGPSGPGEHVRNATSKHLTGLIVAMAMIETVAIYGFILFIMGDELSTLYSFAITSLVFMIAYYPKSAQLEAIVTDLMRGGTGV